jgi:hypothetical protein
LSYINRNRARQTGTNRTTQAEISNLVRLSFPGRVKTAKLRLWLLRKAGQVTLGRQSLSNRQHRCSIFPSPAKGDAAAVVGQISNMACLRRRKVLLQMRSAVASLDPVEEIPHMRGRPILEAFFLRYRITILVENAHSRTAAPQRFTAELRSAIDPRPVKLTRNGLLGKLTAQPALRS